MGTMKESMIKANKLYFNTSDEEMARTLELHKRLMEVINFCRSEKSPELVERRMSASVCTLLQLMKFPADTIMIFLTANNTGTIQKETKEIQDLAERLENENIGENHD